MSKRAPQRRIDSQDVKSYKSATGGAPLAAALANHGHLHAGDGGELVGYARAQHQHPIADVSYLLVESLGGLAVSYTAGRARKGIVVTDIPEGTIDPLPASSTIYVYLNLETAQVQTSTVGFVSGGIPLAVVTTNANEVTGISDKRSLLVSDEGQVALHTHVEADITDLDKYTQAQVDTLLGGKANTAHTHVEADITNLQNYLIVSGGRRLTIATSAPGSPAVGDLWIDTS
jgi:hypothetical protein